jgi:PAS domain S-box-containing protein
VLYANRKLSEISQYSNSELVGVDNKMTNSELHPASFFTDMWLLLAKGKTWHGEIMNRSKDGNFYWVDAVIIPMLDENGEILQYLSLKTLISDKMKAKLDSEKNIFLLYEVLSNTVDELNTPLSDCINQLELYEKKGFENITPEELNIIAISMRRNCAELNEFKQNISKLILTRKKNIH